MDLSALRDLRACVRCGPGIRFDFQEKRAEPGRRWCHLPKTLAELLAEDMRPEELRELRQVAGLDSAPCGATALVLVGPSGAGKSRLAATAAELLGLELRSFASVDGDVIRGCHGAWKRYVLGERQMGYFDAYERYTSNKKNKGLKIQLLRELLEAGRNVLYSDTHVKDSDLQLMKALGYRICAVGLAISLAESDARQRQRAEETGRWGTAEEEKWLVTMGDVIKVCRVADQALIFDSSDVLNPRRIYVRNVEGLEDVDEWQSTFARLKKDVSWRLPREGHPWCECLSLSGLYRKEDGGTALIRVLEPCQEVSEVEVEGSSFQFSVRTCALHEPSDDPFFVGAAVAQLDVTSQVLRWADGRRWRLVEKTQGSICRAVREDLRLLEALTEGDALLDFCSQPFRDLVDQEWREACEAAGGGATGSRALLVMAPSAGGKTTVVRRLADTLRLQGAVHVDGALVRECHEQYRLVCQNGLANDAIWYNAWPSVKKVVQNAKKEMMRLAMDAGQPLVVSESGAELEPLRRLVAELQTGGYEVSLLGIYADPGMIMQRGIARELKEGKRYHRSHKKLVASFENLQHAIQMVDGPFKIVHNIEGGEPQVVLEGVGLKGRELPESWRQELADLVRL